MLPNGAYFYNSFVVSHFLYVSKTKTKHKMENSERRQCKRLLHNHNKKVTKQERDLCYFENYPRKKRVHLISLGYYQLQC